MSPLELVQSTSPTISSLGEAFYFHPDTLAVGKDHGLDGFRFYFLGRGGVLGDVEPAVVVSAFGYFNPGVVEAMWTSGKQIMAPRDVSRLYYGCADQFGRTTLAGVEGLDAFNDAAATVIDSVDVAALSLFAGTAAEPLPEDAAARAYRYICTLRELRGSVHLLAIVATGLDPVVAHAIRRPDAVAMFGWDPAPKISDIDRSALAAADELTDRLLLRPYASLGDEQAGAFTAGLRAIEECVG
jgi:hypothetical protein